MQHVAFGRGTAIALVGSSRLLSGRLSVCSAVQWFLRLPTFQAHLWSCQTYKRTMFVLDSAGLEQHALLVKMVSYRSVYCILTTYCTCRHCPEAYRPPETASACILTTAADVYQFGGLLEFMVTGQHPADNSSLTHHGNGTRVLASDLATYHACSRQALCMKGFVQSVCVAMSPAVAAMQCCDTQLNHVLLHLVAFMHIAVYKHPMCSLRSMQQRRLSKLFP